MLDFSDFAKRTDSNTGNVAMLTLVPYRMLFVNMRASTDRKKVHDSQP